MVVGKGLKRLSSNRSRKKRQIKTFIRLISLLDNETYPIDQTAAQRDQFVIAGIRRVSSDTPCGKPEQSSPWNIIQPPENILS
jgi:hypothetical protein